MQINSIFAVFTIHLCFPEHTRTHKHFLSHTNTHTQTHMYTQTHTHTSSRTRAYSAPEPNDFTYNEIQTGCYSGGWQLALQITEHFPSIVHFLPSPFLRYFSLCLLLMTCVSYAIKSIWNCPPLTFSSLSLKHTFVSLSVCVSPLSFSPSQLLSQLATSVRYGISQKCEVCQSQKQREERRARLNRSLAQ